jgi:hypothetical protein
MAVLKVMYCILCPEPEPIACIEGPDQKGSDPPKEKSSIKTMVNDQNQLCSCKIFC